MYFCRKNKTMTGKFILAWIIVGYISTVIDELVCHKKLNHTIWLVALPFSLLGLVATYFMIESINKNITP